jgi:hypothetical protein
VVREEDEELRGDVPRVVWVGEEARPAAVGCLLGPPFWVTTTGRPAAMASTTVMPKGSYSAGRQKTPPDAAPQR